MKFHWKLAFCICIEIVRMSKSEESLLWYTANQNYSLIAPSYLPEAKKENRRLAIVLEGCMKEFVKASLYIDCVAEDFEDLELECVMNGFAGNTSSQPKWTTDLDNWQISSGADPVIDNGYARWKVLLNVSHDDAGIKVEIFYFLPNKS